MSKPFSKKPMRSRDNVVIAGVCAGLAKSAEVDPFWVRLGAILLIPVTGFFIVIVYIILVITMDVEPV